MTVDSTYVTILTLGISGALAGVLLAARCLLCLRRKYAREAQEIPGGEILWRLPLVFVPISKIPYAFIGTVLIAERHAAVPSWLPWAVGGAFALVAIVQGMLAAALGNPDRSGGLARLADSMGARMPRSVIAVNRVPFAARKEPAIAAAGLPISLVILSVIETLAILALVGTIILSSRLAN